MEKGMLKGIAVLILVLMVILIIVESSIRGIKNYIDEREELSKYEEQQEIYQNSEKYKEEVELTGVIAEVQELLKQKNKDKLYELIDVDYKDYKFQNKKELFDEYISEYIADDVELSLQTYEKINNKYVCRVLSNKNGEYDSFVVLIKLKNEDESNYSLIFDNITAINKKDISQENEQGIKLSILYSVSAEKTLIYSIEYKNMTNKEVSYQYDSVSLSDTLGNVFSPQLQQKEIIIKPGEAVRQEFVFYADNIYSFDKKFLKVDLKDSNGKIINFTINLR